MQTQIGRADLTSSREAAGGLLCRLPVSSRGSLLCAVQLAGGEAIPEWNKSSRPLSLSLSDGALLGHYTSRQSALLRHSPHYLPGPSLAT
jgi:hypothetical protein